MKRLFLFFLLPAFVAVSCRNEHPPISVRQAIGTADSTQYNTAERYRHYAGTINGQAVVADLIFCNRIWSGYFHYLAEGRSICLRQGADTGTADKALLTEAVAADYSEEAAPVQWELSLSGDSATGTRKAGYELQHIALRELRDSGSLSLALLYHSVTAPYSADADTPFATNTSLLLWCNAQGDPAIVQFVNTHILQLAGCDSFVSVADKHAVMDCIRERDEAYMRDYRETIGAIAGNEEQLKSSLNNYTAQALMSVRINEAGWLVLDVLHGEYTGGAHGNYFTTISNLDLRGKKEWKLNDVLQPDTAKLKLLLDVAARKYFGIKDKEPLSKRMVVDEMTVTDNICISSKGISFCYQPYEVASFADGMVELFIPYEELRDLLTPQFIMRMGLPYNSAGGAGKA